MFGLMFGHDCNTIGAPLEEPTLGSFKTTGDTVRAPKRVDVATLYAVGGTFLPVVGGSMLFDGNAPAASTAGGSAVAMGLLVGPSLGHFYAHNRDQARSGLYVRGGSLLGGGLALWALRFTFAPISPGGPDRSSDGQGREDKKWLRKGLTGTVIVSAAVLLFRTTYDLASTPRAVHTYNARPNVRATVVPHAAPAELGAGLTLRVHF